MISFCNTSRNNLTITEHNRIDDVKDIWNIILPPHHSLLSENLKVLENSQPESMVFKYLLVHKNNALVGVLYLQHLKITTNHFDGTIIDKPGLGWLKKCVNSQFSDILVCGNLFRIHFPGYYFKNPTDDKLVFEILTDYLKSSKDNKRFCGIVLKDSPHLFSVTEKFKPYHDDVTMEIELKNKWTTLEDYKNSLSKKYKQRFIKIRKAKELLVLKEFSTKEILDNASKIEELYLNVALKQSLRIGFVNANYFIEMKRRHGDAFIFKAYYFKKQFVAFSTNIAYENSTREIHFIGLDYAYNESHCLYFNILFDGLEMAIASNATKLELGRTARVAKASLGALPLEVHNYIFLRKGLPSLAFSFFNNWFIKNIGEEWQNRNPFK